MSEVTVFERAVLDGINALKQDEIVDAFFYEELSMEGLKKYPDDFAAIAKFAASLDLTDFKMVDSYGGEGQGDTYYRVFNVFVQVPINPENFLKIYYNIIM